VSDHKKEINEKPNDLHAYADESLRVLVPDSPQSRDWREMKDTLQYFNAGIESLQIFVGGLMLLNVYRIISEPLIYIFVVSCAIVILRIRITLEIQK
jgi:hypothetical protein